MKTYVTKPSEVEREWFVVDAEGKTLGRLATEIARRLCGKHKPRYSPDADVGDYVIVINAEKVRVTGRKLEQKVYYRHSGYPGGLKEITLRQQLVKHPTRVIEHAVRGMLPKNTLGRRMFRKLKVYAGPNHPHQAQRPRPLEW
ncbi:MAG TPA: 50S ribosomal protein L13 [Chloroflexi bacterium]|nr:50S ribosomal protein L13 [Chloroflexota bacterium]